MMDEAQFWALIEQAWPSTQQASVVHQMTFSGELEDSDELYEVQKQLFDNLTTALDRLDANDLLAFDRILERKLYDIDRADIHEYTDGSDDGFLYRRGFIVSMGRDYYETVQTDPSSAIMEAECEDLCYLPYWLYEQKYGPMPRSEISRETGSNPKHWSEKA